MSQKRQSELGSEEKRYRLSSAKSLKSLTSYDPRHGREMQRGNGDFSFSRSDVDGMTVSTEKERRGRTVQAKQELEMQHRSFQSLTQRVGQKNYGLSALLKAMDLAQYVKEFSPLFTPGRKLYHAEDTNSVLLLLAKVILYFFKHLIVLYI